MPILALTFCFIVGYALGCYRMRRAYERRLIDQRLEIRRNRDEVERLSRQFAHLETQAGAAVARRYRCLN